MAIAAMSHIRLVGLRSQENRIMDVLTERGVFEPRKTDRLSRELACGDASTRELKLKQGRISFALDFIKRRHEEMAAALAENERLVKKDPAAQRIDYQLMPRKFSSARMLIKHADFADARAKEYDLLGVCDSLEAISFEMTDCKAKISAINNSIQDYAPYLPSKIKFSELAKTGDVFVDMYYSGGFKPVDEQLRALVCAFDYIVDGGCICVVVSRAAARAEAEKVMNTAGYERCVFADDCTAAQKIDALNAERADLEKYIFELTKKALAYEKYYDELRILYDVIQLEVERAEADEGLLKTDSTFVLEGWIPEAAAGSVVADIKTACPKTFIQLLEPEERDAPPTLLVNKEIIKPYEDVTNLYTVPKYREIDPNPIMSIFYFIFFGIMVGDAVYGLVLAIVGLVLGHSKKFDTGVKRLLVLVGWGGVSAVIWGVLFGGYLSIDFGAKKVALWFNPMNEPLTLLIMSIVLGCVQLVAAYIIKIVAECKNGHPLDGALGQGPILLIFGAAACLGLNFVLKTPISGLNTAAIVLGVTAVAIMLVFGGRKKKGIGKILGGFGEIYGLINIISDVLSYCRLFGLCLASAAIGLAFNTLGTIIFGIPVLGYPIGIILLVPLHAFNLALGVLSAYVHDARLQYLEFYGKFYEGGGRLFAPLGSKGKHTRYA